MSNNTDTDDFYQVEDQLGIYVYMTTVSPKTGYYVKVKLKPEGKRIKEGINISAMSNALFLGKIIRCDNTEPIDGLIWFPSQGKDFENNLFTAKIDPLFFDKDEDNIKKFVEEIGPMITEIKIFNPNLCEEEISVESNKESNNAKFSMFPIITSVPLVAMEVEIDDIIKPRLSKRLKIVKAHSSTTRIIFYVKNYITDKLKKGDIVGILFTPKESSVDNYLQAREILEIAKKRGEKDWDSLMYSKENGDFELGGFPVWWQIFRNFFPDVSLSKHKKYFLTERN